MSRLLNGLCRDPAVQLHAVLSSLDGPPRDFVKCSYPQMMFAALQTRIDCEHGQEDMAELTARVQLTP